MNGSLRFKDRSAEVLQFRQAQTYLGLLEGVPDTAINRRLIEGRRQAAQRFCRLENIHVIEPLQHPLRREIQALAPAQRPPVYKASLPCVTCMIDLASEPYY